MATQPAVEILLLECRTSMRDVADGEDAMASGHAASAADQCASLLDEAGETVALSLELPSRYLSFAVLFILLWKKESKSGYVLRGKRRRLDIEDIVPTPTADAADDNVEDRSLSVFCFSVQYCIIADQHLKY